MKTKLISFLLLALVGGASAAELPEATQALLLEKKIVRAMEAGDDASTKALFIERDQLKIKMPPALMMERVEFNLRLGDYLGAYEHLTEYFAAADPASPLYDNALNLLITLEEQPDVAQQIEAGREAEAKAEVEREAKAKAEAKAIAKFAEEMGRPPSPKAKDASGWTDLHHAAYLNLHETAALLLEKGAWVKAKENILGLTPLHIAAMMNARETAALLLEKGAAVNAKNNNGWTPLHTAALENAHETVALLIEKGAAVNAKAQDWYTPLYIAVKNNAHETAALLRQHGGTE